MLTTTETDLRASIVVVALVGAAALVPTRWRASARRAWSFAVYYVGFRLLAVHMTCGSWAVSGMPLVVKYAGA